MQIFRSSGGVWCARMRFRCEAAQRFQPVSNEKPKPLIRTPTQRAKCALLHIVLRYRIIHGDAAASGRALASDTHSLSELAILAFACTHDLAHTTRAGPSFRNRRLGGPSAAPKAGREAALVGAQRSARRSIGGNSSAPSAKERDTQSVRGFPIVFERGRVTSGSSLTITIY